MRRPLPPRETILEPCTLPMPGSPSLHAGGVRPVRPGDPDYEEVYQRRALLYTSFGIPIPYQDGAVSARLQKEERRSLGAAMRARHTARLR